MRIPLKKLVIISIFLLLTCCINQIETRGYSFELSDYKLVKEGISSKDLVLKDMGYPTFTIDNDNGELWVFFSENVDTVLFFKPTILKRQIMVLTFNNHDIVDKIYNYDLTNENKVSFVGDYTHVEGKEEGFFSGLFGNIGQIRPN